MAMSFNLFGRTTNEPVKQSGAAGKSIYNMDLKQGRNIRNTPVNSTPKSGGYTSWGANNMFPYTVLDWYANSPTMARCIDFTVNSIMGSDIVSESDNLELINPNYKENWFDIMEKISFDLVTFGCFVVYLVKNNDDKTYSLFHLPMNQCRIGKDKIYYNDNWGSGMNRDKIEEIDIFNYLSDDITKVRKGKKYGIFYKEYSSMENTYSLPKWYAAQNAIKTEIEMIQADLFSSINGFNSPGMVVLRDTYETEEEKIEMVRAIENATKGTENMSRILISFDSNTDPSAKPFAEFIPFAVSEKEKKDSNRNTSTDSVNRILCAFGISYSNLIGIPNSLNGLTSQADTLQAAYNLFETNIVRSFRREITGVINKFLEYNNIGTQIKIIPNSFNIADGEIQNNEETTVQE
jgi:hypothetical protein